MTLGKIRIVLASLNAIRCQERAGSGVQEPSSTGMRGEQQGHTPKGVLCLSPVPCEIPSWLHRQLCRSGDPLPSLEETFFLLILEQRPCSGWAAIQAHRNGKAGTGVDKLTNGERGRGSLLGRASGPFKLNKIQCLIHASPGSSTGDVVLDNRDTLLPQEALQGSAVLGTQMQGTREMGSALHPTAPPSSFTPLPTGVKAQDLPATPLTLHGSDSKRPAEAGSTAVILCPP